MQAFLENIARWNEVNQLILIIVVLVLFCVMFGSFVKVLFKLNRLN